jgi:hypothetical protein
MKQVPLFAGLAVLAMAGIPGCETPQDSETGDEATTAFDARPLVFPQPVSDPKGPGKGKWVAVPRNGGMEYAQVLGDMEDVVSFYGFWSETAPGIRTFDDMERVMRSDETFGFQKLERDVVLGVPVLWFEKSATERGAGSAKLAQLMKAEPRRVDGTYQVRTRGVFMIQPGPSPRFVTIACTRTSTHGEIGSYYRDRFMAWLTTIIENCFL